MRKMGGGKGDGEKMEEGEMNEGLEEEEGYKEEEVENG